MKSNSIVHRKKSERSETQILFAQYFTPSAIADYMSSLFRVRRKASSILDPGAGEGILGLTLLDRLKDASATFIELDDQAFKTLESNTATNQTRAVELIHSDFIDAAFELEDRGRYFSHIILNPPYFKLRVDSVANQKLRRRGVHVTNIYAAFVWLSARLLEDGGELVAIIPRSFCNGPYFRKFREYILKDFSLDTIHIFLSRDKAFAQDSVLQENIILHISKRPQRAMVKIVYSTDQSFDDMSSRKVPFESVVIPSDPSKTIHIPAENQTLSLGDYVAGTLVDLGIMVSTGPIVDFRSKENILENSNEGTIPLLYPAHMSGDEIEWPRQSFRKMGQYYKPVESANRSLLGADQTADRQVLPLDGFYVVVRRFSSKEEKRRIFASVVDPNKLNNEYLTFENHLNYFHIKKHGFEKSLARGLCAYLNSSILDAHFRKVSGHTQVNVSDLKNMPYPSRDQLIRIGEIKESIDELMDDIVTREVLGKIDE